MARIIFYIIDCQRVSYWVANDEYLFFPSGDGGVEEVAFEHDEVLFEEGDDDDGKFAALGFMDRDGVGEGEVAHFHAFDFGYLAIEVDGEGRGLGVYGDDFTEVAIEDVFIVVVACLDDFIVDFETGAADVEVFGGSGVEGGLEGGIEIMDTGGAFMERDEDLDVHDGVDRGLFWDEVFVEGDDFRDAVIGVRGMDKLEVLIVKGEMFEGIDEGRRRAEAFEDGVGCCDNVAAFLLSEDFVKGGCGDGGALDDVV